MRTKSTMRFLLIAAAIILAACTKEASTTSPASHEPTTDYGRRLAATKSRFHFQDWPARAQPMVTGVFERLLTDLAAAGEGASEQQKLECFARAVTALNEIDRKDRTVIETSEAEELVELGNVIARAAGLDPRKYGDGEGPLSAGRSW